ncbi:beta-galactosidase [Colletotrichum truncatum]|uniref:Beta-galactosidase n=1 Tax=Colletotrichum truncatum TaxID=5467 RepID=A0ACC3YUN2_COLTU|nr:beta-galactosidase [Colletotrichum truncatum]KAF6785834.1 beta-galactosidase [Colletotrichum truncatum]
MAKTYRFVIWLAILCHVAAALSKLPPQSGLSIRQENNSTSLQDLVSWDEYTIKARGERIIFFSGEVHPFRLPSPGLWLDVFQKIRAMGFTGVSFYVMWGLLEGEPGQFRADGVFALEEFFKAASEAGIYLLARPGPYINAEVSGGGFPGWLQRSRSPIRTSAPEFINATQTYLNRIGKIISEAQITNGGPIILVQPENEYSICSDYSSPATMIACLDKEYMANVQSQLRAAGVVVPFLNNDGIPIGNFAPGTGIGEVDIFGVDDYPFQWGSGCVNPSDWGRDGRSHSLLRMINFTKHMAWDPNGPFAVPEFQAASADPWGGAGVDSCSALINHEFSRVFNKIMFGMRVSVLNLYMMFGGTNWGNLGHQGGYTSYDGGSPIDENRQVIREKYSELKLQANFLRSSPTWSVAQPANGSYGVYTDTDALVVTPLFAQPSGAFYVVGHAAYASQDVVSYRLRVSTQEGNFTLPLLGGNLTLNGRDSKIHVADYPIGSTKLIYSTAEVFSWTRLTSKTVVILYGGSNGLHEFAVPSSHGCPKIIGGVGIRCKIINSLAVIQWEVQEVRRVAHFASGVEIHLLWRNEAYQYWTLDLPLPEPIGRYPSASRLNSTNATVIVKAGNLIRSASSSGEALYLSGDVNATTEIEVIAAPFNPTQTFFNGKEFKTTQQANWTAKGTVEYNKPSFTLPELSSLEWRYIDSLPEVQPNYDDSRWVPCSITHTNNTRNLTTPTSLYSGDYGFQAGSLLYRGNFKATGAETAFFLSAQGGNAFGHSVWLNNTYLGSWTGNASNASYEQTFNFPWTLKEGQAYVLTVLIDHMGLHGNWEADGQGMREPRGILNYDISGFPDKSEVTWKITGNFGGEQYVDHSRGPLNEGSMYAERNGFHLPGAPTSKWIIKSPFEGLNESGIGLFATNLNLDMPEGYDIPLSLVVDKGINTSRATATSFRLQLFVNGWQIGKYVNNIGPQYRFVVPEGIMNYNGDNYIALTLWSLEKTGARLESLAIEADAEVLNGYKKPALVRGNAYKERGLAY